LTSKPDFSFTKADLKKIDEEVDLERINMTIGGNKSVKPYEKALASASKNIKKELKDFDEITDADERDRAIRDIKQLMLSIEIYKQVIKMMNKA